LLDIPFAALMDASGRRLIERFPLSTSVSLGMLAWPANTRKPTASLLCMAPFSEGDKAPESTTHGTFGPLPFTQYEADEIGNLVPGSDRYLGRAANKSVLLPKIGRYAVLHFATHGVLEERNGLRTALLLAPMRRAA
jgi:CHAT domain-containing protein